MKRTFLLPLVFILCASLAFSQQNQLVRRDSNSARQVTSSPGHSVYPVEPLTISSKTQDVARIFPARGGSVDWGLALSGGGIRSASFSIGVMKALYDKGLIDQLDVISSVSGGGFASYWLFSSYDPSDGSQKFGDAALKDEVYVKNICELQGTGNFFTLKAMLKSLFRTKSKVFNEYERAIQRSFGAQRLRAMKEEPKLDFLNSSIAEGKAPYFIFNASLRSKELGGFGRAFELTPTYIGNPVIGFHRWAQDDKNILRFSEGATMSAAAVEGKLGRLILNYAPHIFADGNLYLSDGGFSENLAALPLIRRGVKNIIIVDAEHDPRYEFGGYKILQKLLVEMGVEFSVPEIEKFLGTQAGKKRKKRDIYSASAVSVGYAKSSRVDEGQTPIDSHIYYVKMSRPVSIFASASNAGAEPGAGAKENVVKNIKEAYDRGFTRAQERDEKVKPRCPKCDYYCEGATGAGFKSDMYVYLVNYYSEFMDRKKLRRSLNKVLPSFLVSDFPQTTTADQSFYRDQLEAFVGLGYLQALEVKPIP